MDKLNGIISNIKARKCVIFIGAGISKLAGCDLWKDLICKIKNDELIKNKTAPIGIKNEPNEVVIEYYKNIFIQNNNINKFWSYFRELIYLRNEKFDTDYINFINILKRIDPFPKIILTTNFDINLERAKLVTLDKIYGRKVNIKYNKDLEGLFHIHGSIEDGIEKLVITNSQYIERYKETTSINFLKSIARNNSILFLGYSLERDIKCILNEVKNSGEKHYLLVEEKKLKEMNIDLYENMWGVNLINFGSGYSNLDKALGSWVENNFKTSTISLLDIRSDLSNIVN